MSQPQQQRQASLSGSSDTSSLSPKPTDNKLAWDEADSGVTSSAASPTKPTPTPGPAGDGAAQIIHRFLATRYKVCKLCKNCLLRDREML